VLLLAHTGRKSGRRRTTPVLYIQDGDDLIVVASRAGSDFDPAWWPNLKANPAPTVQVRSQRRQVVARQATPEEKERL
jgi:deazaflavin-dependent oxidoreductase (nitroreductase family)